MPKFARRPWDWEMIWMVYIHQWESIVTTSKTSNRCEHWFFIREWSTYCLLWLYLKENSVERGLWWEIYELINHIVIMFTEVFGVFVELEGEYNTLQPGGRPKGVETWRQTDKLVEQGARSSKTKENNPKAETSQTLRRLSDDWKLCLKGRVKSRTQLP